VCTVGYVCRADYMYGLPDINDIILYPCWQMTETFTSHFMLLHGLTQTYNNAVYDHVMPQIEPDFIIIVIMLTRTEKSLKCT